MKTDLSANLGDKVLESKNLDIYLKGIANEYESLCWEEIDTIYVGGEKNSVNLATTYEDWTLKLLNEKTRKSIEFSVSSILWDLGKKKEQLFSEVYSIVLSSTSRKLWMKFLESLRTGNTIYLNEFAMNKDIIFVPKMFGKDKQIGVLMVTGSYLSQGEFFIHYQEKQKIKTKKLGEVSSIPNIHILQKFFNLKPELKTEILNTLG